jgi:hypothetical protein
MTMRRFAFLNTLVLAGLAFSLRAVAAEPASNAMSYEREVFLESYAASLMRERDYYRAITILKELRFASTSPANQVRYTLEITKAYAKGQRYPSALSLTPYVLNAKEASSEDRAAALMLGGESYLGLKIPFQAELLLKKSVQEAPPCSKTASRSELLLGVARADSDDWTGASKAFRALSARNTFDSALAAELADKAEHAADRPSRSPIGAAVLSAVFPGAGQAYSGHWVDAAQAFMLVSAFGFASLLAYKYEHDRDQPLLLTGVSLSITAIFHVSNILGAERTARFYNQRQRDLYVGAIRDRVLALP